MIEKFRKSQGLPYPVRIISQIMFFISLSALFFLSQCNFRSTVNVDPGIDPFPNLSEYNFFTGDMKDLNPASGVLPYDLINPLFSDYAEKARFVWMPHGQKAIYNDTAVIEFPIGTALIKNFYYPFDFRKKDSGRRILETRLLIKGNSGWNALPYIWNDEQTEAVLEITGGTKKINWLDRDGNEVSLDYSIPNKNQCKSCHVSSGKFQPIGPKARNLNCNLNYSDGERNQLEKWADSGYLKNFPVQKNIPKLASWDNPESGTLRDRALAYLEINCAHCHSPGGPAATSGLFLTTFETNTSHLGIYKTPVAAGKGTGGLLYDIVPGKPGESILFYRMVSLDPGVMMPELGRKLVHKEGVQLVGEWISSLKNENEPPR